ncbi:IS30 family transposase [Povalibacter uvarum]|uniref:IS30 family transposase n=1 Tax=Povalibacter uvarum TaxID=732238 RepID=UPI00161753E2|nr:IS30 family transposase [Povalibacter uvarum]
MLRKRLSAEEQAQIWSLHAQGRSDRAIGQRIGRPEQTVRRCLERRGGFAPAARRRNEQTLSLAEREEISRGLCAHRPLRRIAAELGRAPSSISREIRRHGGCADYRALEADAQAWDSARRPKPCLLSRHPRLRAVVSRKLRGDWSPQQIAGWLPKAFAGDHSMRVSHETIYRTLFIQSRGALKRQLLEHLRRGRTLRRSRTHQWQSSNQWLEQAFSIRQRPAEAEDRAVPGHWEGDLLVGLHRSQIATLVERHSRFVMLVKLPAHDSPSVVKALSRKILQLPQQLRRSLTWDRGGELARHQQFTIDTQVKVYFCDPHSPWQRGSNENTNGLLRQYFPKGTDLSVHSQRHLDAIARRLNERPRQTLGFETPADTLARSVASTV